MPSGQKPYPNLEIFVRKRTVLDSAELGLEDGAKAHLGPLVSKAEPALGKGCDRKSPAAQAGLKTGLVC